MSNTPIRIGVFIPGEVQLLDLACVDIFHMMSKEYLSVLPNFPKHIIDIAPSVQIFYITSTETKQMVPLTANMTIRATHYITDAEVQPGLLDIVLVPGPEPSASWDKPVLEFLRAHSESTTTDVLSVCTGILLCGAASLLDGRTASGPRGLKDTIQKRHPTVKLVGEKYRWIQDGNFWSSGEFSSLLVAKHGDDFWRLTFSLRGHYKRKRSGCRVRSNRQTLPLGGG